MNGTEGNPSLPVTAPRLLHYRAGAAGWREEVPGRWS